jgi:hypothetical protein
MSTSPQLLDEGIRARLIEEEELEGDDSVSDSSELTYAEILIPADGDCLYSSVFLGYLQPTLDDSLQFSERIYRLIGQHDREYEGLRTQLLSNLRNIPFLQSNFFKRWILLFRENMGLNDGRWGGSEEIKILSDRLNIAIQELIENRGFSEERIPYIDSSLVQPSDSSEEDQFEVIFILQTDADSQEVIDDRDDEALRAAKIASASSSIHQQHYRLMLTADRTVELTEELDDEPEEDDNASLNVIRFIRTLGITNKMFQFSELLLNPSADSFAQQLSSVNQDFSLQQAIGSLFGNNSIPTFLASGFQSGSMFSIRNPQLKSSESRTIVELMMRVGMTLRPEYFSPLKEEQAISDNIVFAIGVSFLKELVRNGTIERGASHVKNIIQEKEKNPTMLAAWMELVDGFESALKYAGSEAVHDPDRDPLNEYVPSGYIKRCIELRAWLERNRGHQKYDRIHEEFTRISEVSQSKREEKITEIGERIVALSKVIMPELNDIETFEDLTTHHKKKWNTTQRREFKEYILNEYGRIDIFEPSALRSFEEKLQRHQYGKIYYQMVCESFTDVCKDSEAHLIMRQIWSISQLDTICAEPTEAKSRMPATSIDGYSTQNFGYGMPFSDSYQRWLTNPLARVCGDIVIDAFHFVVDLGQTLNAEDFLSQFDFYISHTEEQILDAISSAREEDAYDYEYAGFIFSFMQFLLTRIYKQSFDSQDRDGLKKALLKAAQSRDNLLEKATNALNDFKEFPSLMFLLRPDDNALSEDDRFKNPLVLGIGFNGNLFEAPSHSEVNKDEIWLSFSQKGRDLGGYLFLSFVGAVSHSGRINLINSLRNPADIQAHFEKHKTLIRKQVERHLKGNGISDLHWKSATLIRIEAEQARFRVFMEELDQSIPFESLDVELKNWILELSNWYYIPSDINIEIPEEMPVEEHDAQKLARELLLDAIIKRKFSEEHSDLMPFLFLNWKGKLLELVKLKFPSMSSKIEQVRSFSDISEVDKKIVLDLLDELIWNVHPQLITQWHHGDDGIDKKFESYLGLEQYYKEKIQKIKEIKDKIKSLQKQKKGDRNISKIEELLAKAEEQLEEENKTFPKKPADCAEKYYEAFKKLFFDRRSVSQCIEPAFARVVGHDRFFSVFISKQVGKTNIKDRTSLNSPPLQLGNRISYDVIAPCNRLCQHHALGHLYVGDSLSYQSADRLDQQRLIHGMLEVPDRILPIERLEAIRENLSRRTLGQNASLPSSSSDSNYVLHQYKRGEERISDEEDDMSQEHEERQKSEVGGSKR